MENKPFVEGCAAAGYVQAGACATPGDLTPIRRVCFGCSLRGVAAGSDPASGDQGEQALNIGNPAFDDLGVFR